MWACLIIATRKSRYKIKNFYIENFYKEENIILIPFLIYFIFYNFYERYIMLRVLRNPKNDIKINIQYIHICSFIL